MTFYDDLEILEQDNPEAEQFLKKFDSLFENADPQHSGSLKEIIANLKRKEAKGECRAVVLKPVKKLT
jgi:hypothetical protein